MLPATSRLAEGRDDATHRRAAAARGVGHQEADMSTLPWHRAAVVAAVMALSLIGAQVVQADSQVKIFEDLSDSSLKADSFLVQCGHSTTRSLLVRLCDDDTSEITGFMTQVIGRTPTGLLGRVMVLLAPDGQCGEGVLARGATSGPMSVLVTVVEQGETPLARYALTLACLDKNKNQVGNVTVTKKQDL
jgi:hypothetical protein